MEPSTVGGRGGDGREHRTFGRRRGGTGAATGLAAMLAWPCSALATSIAVGEQHGWGANIGWINFRGDGPAGAMVGLYYCTGYVWSANCGWIRLGSGTPANGHSYQNNTASDWGVNLILPGGFLRGMAWGANIGWINFETNGNPRLDLTTGRLSGFAWGANVGWISLSNAHATVRTEYLTWGPDTDGDGIPDAYELQQVGHLSTLTATGDADGDGAKDVHEFFADTQPTNAASVLRITEVVRAGTTNRVTWTVRPTRLYQLEHSTSLTTGAWTDVGLGVVAPGAAPTLTALMPDPSTTSRFYRAAALVPLAPAP